MIKSIPLNKLVASPRNVRRAVDEEADLRLKADIAARGLIQNLVVSPVRKPRGAFAVEAGGRRHRALLALAAEAAIGKDHEVCCLVIEGAAAQEASLAENFQRLSMNPADECLAFRHLTEQGLNVDDIARRFGLTARFVEGRLRLADLAPPVFEALGAGEIGLDLAKAFAVTSDRERQAWVFEELSRSFYQPHPDSIRRMMTQATVAATDRRARFVGEEAYVAAGGRIECDLFASDAGARWVDVPLLERLVSEKLDLLARETAAEAGLAWVRPCHDLWVGAADLQGLERVPLAREPLTDDDRARAAALEGEIEDLSISIECEEMEEEARQAAEEKLRRLADDLEAIVARPGSVPPELKGAVGTFLLIDEQGRPRLEKNVYREVGPDEQVGEPGESGSGSGAQGSSKPAGLSQRLVDELAMQRRDILAVHVAADPGLALDLAIFLMADRAIDHRHEKAGSSLTALRPHDPVFGFRTPQAAATLAAAEADEALDRGWAAGKSRAERFDGFRALPEEQRAAWLGHAVAATLEASLRVSGQRSCAFHDHLGSLLGIDVARWWRPTGTNFFDRVPKGVTLAALAEVGGEAFAARYAKAKKTELASACERIFSGDFIGEIDVKEAALAWVPGEMRFGALPAGAAGEPAADPASDGDREEDACPAKIGEAA